MSLISLKYNIVIPTRKEEQEEKNAYLLFSRIQIEIRLWPSRKTMRPVVLAVAIERQWTCVVLTSGARLMIPSVKIMRVRAKSGNVCSTAVLVLSAMSIAFQYKLL